MSRSTVTALTVLVAILAASATVAQTPGQVVFNSHFDQLLQFYNPDGTFDSAIDFSSGFIGDFVYRPNGSLLVVANATSTPFTGVGVFEYAAASGFTPFISTPVNSGARLAVFVPEPSTFLLAVIGLLGVAAYAWRKDGTLSLTVAAGVCGAGRHVAMRRLAL